MTGNDGVLILAGHLASLGCWLYLYLCWHLVGRVGTFVASLGG